MQGIKIALTTLQEGSLCLSEGVGVQEMDCGVSGASSDDYSATSTLNSSEVTHHEAVSAGLMAVALEDGGHILVGGFARWFSNR